MPEISNAAWYVVHTKPRQETRALENLQNQGFECFLPLLRVEKIRRGRLQKVIEPMFSRYMFIRLSEANQNWLPIRYTRGVNKLVAFGGYPAKVPSTLIHFMQVAPQAEVQRLFEPGDQLLIVDGPLKGLKGTYGSDDGEMRANVLVSLLGRPQNLKMALSALIPVPH